ncbi:CHAD domain-containing protein [Ancylobacter sp. 3268]|uniref:CHAD domain-containing protein n=1 Tax=Ancylobacter sp. 3268 TaxID=2817752 RepID=UPI00285595C5|nr:CHAD domain-containing protein [Ancylobacter sp. 3268]MDR6954624.1 CHAD domain-containing protein [Ancylobacter sp. 3268]
MRVHLDKDAVPPKGRAAAPASGLLGTALTAAVAAAVTALEREDPAELVHDLRKAFKQLRGLLRLVRGGGRRDARALRKEIGAAARTLSHARDRVVMRETLDRLVEKGRLSPAAREAAGAVWADGGGEAAEEIPPAVLAGMGALVARCGRAVAAMDGASPNQKVIAALAADYKRARRRGRSIDISDDVALHELRKAVIAHRYQMEVLAPCWLALGAVWVKELQHLRDKLGHHHDLAVLVEAVGAQGEAETGWRAEVVAGARAQQKKLVRRAMRLQACLFAERPKPFARRMRAYARASHAAG